MKRSSSSTSKLSAPALTATCRRAPSLESGSTVSDSATGRGMVSSTERSMAVCERSTPGIPRCSAMIATRSASGTPSSRTAFRNAVFVGDSLWAFRSNGSGSERRSAMRRAMGSSEATAHDYHSEAPAARERSGGEEEMRSLPIVVGLEQRPDLLAGAIGSNRAEHQAVLARRQVGLSQHGPAARQPLGAIDVVEDPRAQAVRLERPGKTLPRRPGAPEVEIPVAQGPPRQVVRAQPEHRVLPVRGAGPGQAAGRVAPLEQRLRHLRQFPPALDHAQEQVPVLRPAVVLPAALQDLAPERRARMHQRGLDEAAVPALLLAEGLVEPPFQAKKAARERSRKAAHQAARRAGRRIVEEQLCLEAKPIGVDEVVGIHAGDQLSAAARARRPALPRLLPKRPWRGAVR